MPRHTNLFITVMASDCQRSGCDYEVTLVDQRPRISASFFLQGSRTFPRGRERNRAIQTVRTPILTPPSPLPASPLHAGLRLTHECPQRAAPKNSKEKLFDLVYSCRKETTSGEVMLMTWEECGLEAEPCVDAGTDPTTFEVTYQVSAFTAAFMSHRCERTSGRHVFGQHTADAVYG